MAEKKPFPFVAGFAIFTVAGLAAWALFVWVLMPPGWEAGTEGEGLTSGQAQPGAMRTVTVNSGAIARGQAQFAICAGCHGEDAAGRVGQGPSLRSESFLAAASDDLLVRTIKDGREGTTMVPWSSTLTDGQVESIVAYLRSLNDVGPAELDESPLTGEIDEGEHLFRQICSACHGRSGAGYQETANGTGIGRSAFLESVTNGYLRHIIRHGKTDTPMRGFASGDPVAVANLDDEQIDGVIAYLRDSAW